MNTFFVNPYRNEIFISFCICFQKAQQLAKVKHLDISIESYAGYFTVNKPFDSNLFFWFFRAKNNPDDAPILLWLQGKASKSFFLLILVLSYIVFG